MKLHLKKAFGCFLTNENVFLNDKLEPKIGEFGIEYINLYETAKYQTMILRFPYEFPPEYFEDLT